MSELRLRISLFSYISIGAIVILLFLWVMHLNQPTEVYDILTTSLVLLFFSIIISLAIFFWKFDILTVKKKLESKQILTLASIMLVIVQFTFLLINFTYTEMHYIKNMQANSLKAYNSLSQASFLVQFVEKYDITDDSITLEQLNHLEQTLNDYSSHYDSIKSISIADSNYKIIVSNDKEQEQKIVKDDLSSSSFFPIVHNKNIYYLVIQPDTGYHYNLLRNEVLGLLSIIAICILFTIELLSFILKYFENKINPPQLIEGKEESQIVVYLRPLTFIFFFANMMVYALIPIIAEQMKEPFCGISADIWVSMSVTSTILFTCIAIFTTSWLIEKKGWKFPFLLGLSLNLIGDFLSAFAPNLILFILARAIVGIGYGFCWMTLRNISLFGRNTTEKKRAFALMLAGLFAGMNCGVVLGTTLVDLLGYQKIFFIGNILMFLCICFTLKLKNQVYIRDIAQEEVKTSKENTFSKLQMLYIVFFVICIILPTSMASSFPTYFLPLYLYKTGYNIADIGRLQLFYGIVIIYIGPYLAGLRNEKTWTFVHNVFIGSILLLFGLFDSFLAVILAVIGLGIAASFGTIMQNTYFFKFKMMQTIGEAMSLSWLSFIRKITEAVAPALFASFMFLDNFGVALIGGLSILMAIIYFVVLGRRKNSEHFFHGSN